tara:strand:- start:327 stop:431 length:105 start_codon:yes stop_codon:yes gene_type:complete
LIERLERKESLSDILKVFYKDDGDEIVESQAFIN